MATQRQLVSHYSKSGVGKSLRLKMAFTAAVMAAAVGTANAANWNVTYDR
jgi:hypothetical protein